MHPGAYTLLSSVIILAGAALLGAFLPLALALPIAVIGGLAAMVATAAYSMKLAVAYVGKHRVTR